METTRAPFYGEPAPMFKCRSFSNPTFTFDTVAGRYVVLCFYGSATDPQARQTLNTFLANRERFNDIDACFFAISTDPGDESEERVREHLPGLRVFWDFDLEISRLYHCLGGTGFGGLSPQTFVLDERLRVFGSVPFMDSAIEHVTEVFKLLDSLPQLGEVYDGGTPAPILIVPRIFEPKLCRTLIDYYETMGGEESGFVRDVNGKTVNLLDSGHKRRRDQEILDEELRRACMHRIHDRMIPELKKAYQFQATRIERYIVACYDANSGGHFRAHRDNTTKGTAHRKFAVSLHLNTGEYTGGKVWFPEYGRQQYEAPAGAALVFSCSMLHEATPVTSGKRFVFLPFLYDDEGARIRDENLKYVDVAPHQKA